VFRFGLVLVVAALLLAACGGGGGGKRLTKAELIKQGDAICTKYRAKNKELQKGAPAKSPTDPSASDEEVRKSGPILAKLADHVRGARSEFARLEPPKDAESDWKNTLDDLDQIATKLDEAAAAAKDVNRQKIVNAYAEALRLNSRVANFEGGYGFRVCGKSG
jgi:hypothetical protein